MGKRIKDWCLSVSCIEIICYHTYSELEMYFDIPVRVKDLSDTFNQNPIKLNSSTVKTVKLKVDRKTKTLLIIIREKKLALKGRVLKLL